MTVSGPRLSATQQLTLHSGTPSVGPTLASLSSVCGVPSLLARDAEN